jgi:uncharacterized protein (DUF3084 family)
LLLSIGETCQENTYINTFIHTLETLLLNPLGFDEKNQKKCAEIFNKLRKTIINKNKKLFTSRDTKLYDISQEIHTSLLTLSLIYSDIQLCYHKSHNYKELDTLIKYENTLQEKEYTLKTIETDLKVKENTLHEKENTLHEKENTLKEKENTLKEKEKFLAKVELDLDKYKEKIINEMEIRIENEFGQHYKSLSIQRKILKQHETDLHIKELSLKKFQLELFRKQNTTIYNFK